MLELKDDGPENKRGYRYVLVIKDTFSKFGWTVPLNNLEAITLEDSFENNVISSERKQNLSEIDYGKNFITIFFKIS